MLGKAQAKVIKMLQQKKYRQKEALFVVEGEKMVKEAMESSFVIRNVFASQNWLTKNALDNLDSNKFQVVEDKELKKISSLTNPQEVLAILEIPKYEAKIKMDKRLVLALDKVQDPGNLGTIIRIADWFGISDLICSSDCVDAYNPKVVQASMGSIFRVKIHYLELAEWLMKQKSKKYGALLDGKNVWEEKNLDSGILIMGNESQGISEGIKALLDEKLAIPSLGKAESLNVATATAILCAEFAKNRISTQ